MREAAAAAAGPCKEWGRERKGPRRRCVVLASDKPFSVLGLATKKALFLLCINGFSDGNKRGGPRRKGKKEKTVHF